MRSSFTATYPNVARFVDDIGYVEIGYRSDGYLPSFIRTLDSGGMVWEGVDEYPTLDAALAALDAALGDWLEENGIG